MVGASAVRWVASVAVMALSLLVYPQPQPGPAPTYGPPPPAYPPIIVLAVGDSLTYGVDGSAAASYRAELGRLMTLTGQPHTWVVAAQGGTKCSYWADRIDGLIAQHDPDLIFLNCGTNDTSGDDTEGDYRRILSTAQTRGVQVVASLPGQPDMDSQTNTVRPYIWDWMHNTSLAIKRALADYPAVPYADMVRVPDNIEWLQSDGIHLTPRSEKAYGQMFYQAARTVRPGWKSLQQMGLVEMCGLHGHWRGDPWPTPDVAYRVCRT